MGYCILARSTTYVKRTQIRCRTHKSTFIPVLGMVSDKQAFLPYPNNFSVDGVVKIFGVTAAALEAV